VRSANEAIVAVTVTGITVSTAKGGVVAAQRAVAVMSATEERGVGAAAAGSEYDAHALTLTLTLTPGTGTRTPYG
jgi:hypothetical protein